MLIERVCGIVCWLLDMTRSMGGWRMGAVVVLIGRVVVRIRDGLGSGGDDWFEGCVVRRVGDGEDTLFWHDRWFGDASFPSLL